MTTLLWFQRDLRTQNNPALAWAIEQEKPIVAVYLHSPEEDAPWASGASSRWWLHHSLQKLRIDLSQHNVKLQFLIANSIENIPKLAAACNADTVVWTNRHEPYRDKCESTIVQELFQRGIDVRRFNDGILAKPDQFLTESKNTPYKVFTPFYKRLRKELDLSGSNQIRIRHGWKSAASSHVFSDAVELEQLDLLGDHPWHQKLHQYWTPGELNAQKRLDDFLNGTLDAYAARRDLPAVNGTSTLSPYLVFGEINPQQIISALVPLIEFADNSTANAAESFLRQLIWREFARYVLRHFPHTATKPMNQKFSQSFWKNNNHQLERWQRGNTGIPIIDAGMHQLWETGWMHNRVRMLVASLLTKNLGIPWQDGARWFWDTLVDADLANNTMGWQWVAGCGVDAAPYFRVFNPHTQTKRFDPELHYVKRWRKFDTVDESIEPMIDVVASRSQALERYNQLIRGY
ncbi:MAG: deoxyribodipyrimidine photo-lyase [Gammaproteobacteria bacterium]|nr:MAG: deoxyribodipyrimidine photo-lyase [Gammaproteobacteria bacterium]